MTSLKPVLAGIRDLVILLVVVGLVLPRQVHVERSIVIDAPQARFVGLMFDTWIGSDDEKGLAKLKEVMEQGNAG